MRRRVLWSLAALALVSLLSGCSLSELVSSPEDLYSLPALPVKYTELNQQINAILAGGAEYAAPASGTNIQPVQLVDLDGNGGEEAVAFFRAPDDEKPLKIYIFTAEGDSYQQSDLIEASGTSISSIAYEDMDGDGLLELIVGWKAAADLQVLEVYSRAGGTARALIRTNYVRYTTADLNGDAWQDLVVLRTDEEGGSTADHYSWQADGSFTAQTPARLSMTMAELSRQGRVSAGTLREGTPALFVTGVTETSAAVTDILALRGGRLKNIVLSEQTGLSGETSQFCSLYPTDIDGDGCTDVPRPVVREGQTSALQIVDWYTCGEDGSMQPSLQTCHNMTDGWYFRLPEDWGDSVRTSRTTAEDAASVTFYIRGSNLPFLRITAYTGADRELQAVRGSQFLLGRQAETLYAAELLEAGGWEHGMTADQIREAFFLITEEWASGEH